jgi:hypothetical protein
VTGASGGTPPLWRSDGELLPATEAAKEGQIVDRIPIDLAGMPNPPATGLFDGGLSRFGRDKEVSQAHSPRTYP